VRLDLDWTVGLIRIGGTEFVGPEPGTRYDFVVSVFRKGDEAYLFGAHGKFTRQMFTLIKHSLRDQGVKKVTYERLNTETARTREIDTHA
jgi:hypothetical protein